MSFEKEERLKEQSKIIAEHEISHILEVYAVWKYKPSLSLSMKLEGIALIVSMIVSGPLSLVTNIYDEIINDLIDFLEKFGKSDFHTKERLASLYGVKKYKELIFPVHVEFGMITEEKITKEKEIVFTALRETYLEFCKEDSTSLN